MRKESTTTNIMRRGFISALAVCATLFSSCSSDSDFAENKDAITRTGDVIAEAQSKTMVDVATRSSLSYSSGRLNFSWDGDDALTVFAKNNDESKMQYNIKQAESYGANSSFTSTDFILTDDKTYIALSKIEGHGGGPATKIPDQRNITIDYSGQVQKGNANPAHLGYYDFMAAATTVKPEEDAHFSFEHIAATMRIVAMSKTGDETFKTIRFHKIDIYDSENSFRQPERSFSLDAGMQSDNTYKVVWPEQTITSDKRFSVDLQDNEDDSKGVLPKSSFVEGGTNTYNDLVVYVEVPPTDFTGKTMGIILYGKDSEGHEVTYYGTHKGVNLEAGNAYNLYFVSQQTTDYNVTLKLNHLWQHGNTVTRTTGDPGYDKDINLPKYIYYVFSVDEKVRAVKDTTGTGPDNAYNTITVTGADDNKWTLNNETYISTYSKMLTFPTTDDDKDKKKQIFVIASDYELPTSTFDGINDGVAISELLAKTYDIKTPTDQTTSQAFLRDLYSTPWVSEAPFVGDLTDPMQDVILYHVAAKVDLKWNSETEMTVGTGSDIKVSNVVSSGLSLFKPTTNTNDLENGTYTVTTPITYGTFINGRQVYYLPQFSDNQYNVTIGAQNYTPYEFTGTSTEGGFTSWYRALITQKTTVTP